MQSLEHLLLAKEDLETFDSKDISLLSRYFNINASGENDRYWLLILNIYS